MATAFMRYKLGIENESNVLFDVPYPEHPLYEAECVVCRRALGEPKPDSEVAGVRMRVDQDALLTLRPDDAAKYKSGGWISVPAQVVHNACADTTPGYLIGRTVTVVRDDV